MVFAEEWTIKAQERLAENNKWKEICRVDYTNDRVLHNPYITDPTVQTTARGSSYSHQNVVLNDDNVTISDIGILPQLIDRADLAQQTFVNQMELADRQAVLLNEAIETAMLAAHASWTNFGTSSIGGGGAATSPITVSSSNVDDIITGVIREIRIANGEALYTRNGGFIIWRPADFELLTKFAMANGFSTADDILKKGATQGWDYAGLTHFSSNKIAAGHLFAGVKKVFHLGIVKATYGQVVIDEEPATSTGAQSAVAVVMRVDYKFKAWSTVVPILFDINVA